jgi:protein SCO1/2
MQPLDEDEAQSTDLSPEASEEAFAARVDALANDPRGSELLLDLLREDHPVYDQRGAATVVLMRGWVLLAISRRDLTDAALRFVLEELDTGIDPYLVAAAARALRSYPRPGPALAPFVMRALDQIRYRDDPVSFDGYGEYGTPASATSPVRELLATLTWLGPHARAALPDLEAFTRAGGLSRKAMADATSALESIHASTKNGTIAEADSCCALPSAFADGSWLPWRERRESTSIAETTFEDHDGTDCTFRDLFHGQPSIVVFFYTRCDNPLKCSLTVTKLATVQRLLAERGLDDRIRTAAITYDPGFDSAKRIGVYGKDRGVRMDERHCMLRATSGMSALQAHFALGVNFIESIVNRHRVEAYVLDAQGRVAASFGRVRWDERAIVDRAVQVLDEKDPDVASEADTTERVHAARAIAPVFATIAAAGVALFPKCPVCWATYMSMFGIAGLSQLPFPSWLQPVLAMALLANVASAWVRARVTGRVTGPLLVSAGAIAIIGSRVEAGIPGMGTWGVALVCLGSLMSALPSSIHQSLRAARS